MERPEKRELQEGVRIAPLTSIGLGGPAQYFARITRFEQLPAVLDWAARLSLPVTVLGGGSNVVCADDGVAGLVLSIELEGSSVHAADGAALVSVGAGEAWDPFVASCVERGLSGLECLSGIPGRVGATPIQNVGAYGQDVSAVLVDVDVYDTRARTRRTLTREDCGFGYRTSRFKSDEDASSIVLGVTFRLVPGGAACISYPDIARHFAVAAAPPPTIARVRQFVLETRRNKSMLLDPSDENGRSCGSFFLNPELSRAQFDALVARLPSAPPSYPQADGRVKVPAAWLIEQSGFRRGQRFGSVGISSRHALALVCHAGATAAALVDAAHRVRDGVAEATGVTLAPEPRFFGFGTRSDELPALR